MAYHVWITKRVLPESPESYHAPNYAIPLWCGHFDPGLYFYYHSARSPHTDPLTHPRYSHSLQISLVSLFVLVVVHKIEKAHYFK